MNTQNIHHTPLYTALFLLFIGLMSVSSLPFFKFTTRVQNNTKVLGTKAFEINNVQFTEEQKDVLKFKISLDSRQQKNINIGDALKNKRVYILGNTSNVHINIEGETVQIFNLQTSPQIIEGIIY
ncbi:hypothetical protein COV24_00840 [candidate division WWE3 bacterium CG10_big_fil_rev_8_21_14_0_10_32_10]|uniref:Uncharacterized protein n=1 Tax=candidate division WWE3 bacterium CG10_big_fil_rev_8_21_14_0_10_32_10 TaxID=1975090 RepID=A0A2H0RBC8_UNCKA|nr:MAG: hypothetical protein COV24_00840 [candidate division WWE3 bacterium CG10_big_fil_rev_8_21_14_0_10_32_10]